MGKIVEKTELEIPKSFTAYALIGLVGKTFGLPPRRLRLIWETGDWMAPAKGVADGLVEEESDSESDSGESGDEREARERVMREVEIVPGTRVVGTWIDGKEAVIRVEIRS